MCGWTCVYECMRVLSVGVHACFSRARPGTFLTESHSALGSWTLSIVFMRKRAVNKGCRAGVDLCPHPARVQTPSLSPAVGSVGIPCHRGGKAGGLGRRCWPRLAPPRMPPFPGRGYPGPALTRGVVMSPQV